MWLLSTFFFNTAMSLEQRAFTSQRHSTFITVSIQNKDGDCFLFVVYIFLSLQCSLSSWCSLSISSTSSSAWCSSVLLSGSPSVSTCRCWLIMSGGGCLTLKRSDTRWVKILWHVSTTSLLWRRYMSRPVMSSPGLYDPTTIMNADILAYCQKEGWCKLAFYLLSFFYYLYGYTFTFSIIYILVVQVF